MTPVAFESARLIAIVAVVLLKLALMPMYLQCHLDLATERLEIQKKEAGRITNVEFQKKVTRFFLTFVFTVNECGFFQQIAAVFYYLCVVALQYVAPLLICLNFAFMYKSLGNV